VSVGLRYMRALGPRPHFPSPVTQPPLVLCPSCSFPPNTSISEGESDSWLFALLVPQASQENRSLTQFFSTVLMVGSVIFCSSEMLQESLREFSLLVHFFVLIKQCEGHQEKCSKRNVMSTLGDRRNSDDSIQDPSANKPGPGLCHSGKASDSSSFLLLSLNYFPILCSFLS